ncbi:SERTA domain-containing protein 2-like [Salminus brasiliensis]|uniref:SERTA domain-containing protein 2-like n=1 Tax=Salminus brasiliensis TaxID=930266 RepID=UPI003B835BE6
MAKVGAQMTCYLQERQLVLSLCLDKLHGNRMPSLHRSVLLANTMRQIQREITEEKDGPPANPFSAQMPNSQVAMPFRTPEPQIQPLDCIPTLSDMDRGDVDLTCSRCAEEVEMEIDVSFFPSAFATSSSSTPFIDTVFTDSGLLGLTSLVEAGNTRGYLTDLSLDDIFEDIDTSMYDSSEAASLMTCVFCSVSHLFGDEEAKVFSDCPSVSPLQCSPADLNDLDHIMEVLVGLV